MACSHVRDCPLFPKLQASLASWRTHYCDSASGWQACARYHESVAGRPVPLALLPNGKLVQALDPDAVAARRRVTAAQVEAAAPPQEAAAGTAAGARAARVAGSLGSQDTPPLMWWARLFAMLRRSA